MKAVILAAGKGTRLRPYTYVMPKPMLPLAETPILEILTRQLAHYGYDEIIVTSHHLSHMIETYLPSLSGKLPGVTLRHEPQAALMGTSGGLSSIEGLGDDGPFLVMNGDLLCTLDFGALMAYHREKKPALTVGMFSKPYPISLGILETDGNQITGYNEKPTHTYNVSMGVYIYAPETLHLIPENGWQDAPDLVQMLIEQKKTVMAYPFDGIWLDVGTMDDFKRAGDILEQARGRFLPDEA